MPSSDSVKRTIHFFKFDAGLDVEGKAREFNVNDIIKEIKLLNDHDLVDVNKADKKSYWVSDSETYCAWVEKKVKGERRRLKFAKIKRSALPLQEINFQLSSLGLVKGAGIAELIHIVVFPHNIIGFDYNHDGPRIHKFREYLDVKTNKKLSGITLYALLRKEVMKQLEKLKRISVFDARITSGYAGKLEKADKNIYKSIYGTFGKFKPRHLEITMSFDKEEGEKQIDNIIGLAKSFLSIPHSNKEIERLDIKGQRGLDVIHLLNSKLVARQSVIIADSNSKALAPESAYAAIEAAYAKLLPEIKDASGVEVWEDS